MWWLIELVTQEDIHDRNTTKKGHVSTEKAVDWVSWADSAVLYCKMIVDCLVTDSLSSHS